MHYAGSATAAGSRTVNVEPGTQDLGGGGSPLLLRVHDGMIETVDLRPIA